VNDRGKQWRKKAIMLDPRNKLCGCEDLRDDHEIESIPTPSDPTEKSDAEENEHPPSTYLHVEIF